MNKPIINKPIIAYYENGNIKSTSYFINDQLHNNNGPAYTSYCENGNKQYKSYFINGSRHNDNGPAIIRYDDNDNIQHEAYFINGAELEKLQFWIHKKNLTTS